MVSWVVYIAIGLIIGGAAGFFLGRLDDFSQKEKQAMQDKLDQAQKEMANYKHEVTEHFVATAGLVNNLTESYQAVHEHLAKGAKTLCDHQVAVNRLEVTRPVVIDSYNAAAQGAQESTDPKTVVKTGKPSEEGVALQEDVATDVKPVAETHLHESTAEAAAQQGEQGLKPAESHSGRNSAANAERVNHDTTSNTTTTTTTSAADDKTVISDENDLTMASRMVH